MSDEEEVYCRKRLTKLGYKKAGAFLYKVRKEFIKLIDKNDK